MTGTLPPIDAHAHVEPSVPPHDLSDLRALVFAVTRESSEWEAVLRRRDELAVWGVGAHPGVAAAISGFDTELFDAAVDRALLVGEVGLDGRSKVPLADQRRVFDVVLDVVAVRPRPMSIHSIAATHDVLDALRRRPVAAPILHWWRGTQVETAAALELGCYFSLNGAEALRPKVLDDLPPERVLTETDFPHSRRADRQAHQPAAMTTIESALVERWGVNRSVLRLQLWRNLGAVFERCELVGRLPAGVQNALMTARTEDLSLGRSEA